MKEPAHFHAAIGVRISPVARADQDAVFVYQLALLYRFEKHLDLNVGLKAFLKAA